LAGDQLEGSFLAADKYQKRFSDRNFIGGAGEDGEIASAGGWTRSKKQAKRAEAGPCDALE